MARTRTLYLPFWFLSIAHTYSFDLAVLLGNIADCDFYIGAAQFEYWQHTQLIIDVVPGRGSGFSAEAPEGVRFLTRSRVFTDEEVAELEAAGPPARAA